MPKRRTRGGGGWHKALVSDCLPLAVPIGLSPLHIRTLCETERDLVVSTEPPDDLSCLTTPGVGRPGNRLLPVPLTRGIQMHTPSPCGGLLTPALTCVRWGVHPPGCSGCPSRDLVPRASLRRSLSVRSLPVRIVRTGGGGGISTKGHERACFRGGGWESEIHGFVYQKWANNLFLPQNLIPPCDSPSGCCSFTGPWTVTRSSLRMLRRVAAFCRPLRPVLLLVSFPRSRSPFVGVLGLCWLWRDVPFARQRRPVVGVLRMCWLLPRSFDCFRCPRTSVHRPSVACLAVFLFPPKRNCLDPRGGGGGCEGGCDLIKKQTNANQR